MQKIGVVKKSFFVLAFSALALAAGRSGWAGQKTCMKNLNRVRHIVAETYGTQPREFVGETEIMATEFANEIKRKVPLSLALKKIDIFNMSLLTEDDVKKMCANAEGRREARIMVKQARHYGLY